MKPIFLLLFLMSCAHIKSPPYKVKKEIHRGISFLMIESNERDVNLMETALLYQFSDCKKSGNFPQLITSKQEGTKIEQTFVCNLSSEKEREAQAELTIMYCKRNKSEINKEFCYDALGAQRGVSSLVEELGKFNSSSPSNEE